MTLCVVCDGRGFTLLRPVEGIETNILIDMQGSLIKFHSTSTR